MQTIGSKLRIFLMMKVSHSRCHNVLVMFVFVAEGTDKNEKLRNVLEREKKNCGNGMDLGFLGS